MDLLEANDWKIKKTCVLVITLQLCILGLIWIDSSFIEVPIVVQVVGFVYLTFVPGFLILRLLRLHNLGALRALMFALSLSLLFLMGAGFFVNFIYPIVGYYIPLSNESILLTISILIMILLSLSFLRDFSYERICCNDHTVTSRKSSSWILLLSILPIIAIIGTITVNSQKNNLLLMILILLLACIIPLIIYYNSRSDDLYAFAIFIISISLLYHRTLISQYLTGCDIFTEYYFFKLAESNCYWNSTIPYNFNSVLSCNVLPIIYSKFLCIDGESVFKWVFPLLFSFVPVGLYGVFSQEVGRKMAFLSTLYLVSLFTFFTEMPALGKQEIAEIFLAAILLIIASEDIDMYKRKVLYILFCLGLIISHYGLSYLSLILIISSFVILIFLKLFLGYTSNFLYAKGVLFLIVFALCWYMNNSNSSVFDSIIYSGNYIILSIQRDFLDPSSSQALTIVLNQTTPPLHKLLKYMYYVSQILIFFGVMYLITGIVFKKLNLNGLDIIDKCMERPSKFSSVQIAFSFAAFIMLILFIIVPNSNIMNIHRIYHVLMFFLAPFLPLGLLVLLGVIARAVPSLNLIIKPKYSLTFLSIFLAIFLLLNSEWAFEMLGEQPYSISISQNSINEVGSNEQRNYLYFITYPSYDIYGIKWLSMYRNKASDIYADLSHKRMSFIGYGGILEDLPKNILTNDTKIPPEDYCFLGYCNIHFGIFNGPDLFNKYNLGSVYPYVNQKDVVYSNGNCLILG